jgi:hypothetical protein
MYGQLFKFLAASKSIWSCPYIHSSLCFAKITCSATGIIRKLPPVDIKIIAIIMDPEGTAKILQHLVKIGRAPPNFDPASLN